MTRSQTKVYAHSVVGVGAERVFWLESGLVVDEFIKSNSLPQVFSTKDCRIVVIGGLHLLPGISHDGHVLCVRWKETTDHRVVEDHVVTQDVKAKGRNLWVWKESSKSQIGFRQGVPCKRIHNVQLTRHGEPYEDVEDCGTGGLVNLVKQSNITGERWSIDGYGRSMDTYSQLVNWCFLRPVNH